MIDNAKYNKLLILYNKIADNQNKIDKIEELSNEQNLISILLFVEPDFITEYKINSSTFKSNELGIRFTNFSFLIKSLQEYIINNCKERFNQNINYTDLIKANLYIKSDLNTLTYLLEIILSIMLYGTNSEVFFNLLIKLNDLDQVNEDDLNFLFGCLDEYINDKFYNDNSIIMNNSNLLYKDNNTSIYNNNHYFSNNKLERSNYLSSIGIRSSKNMLSNQSINVFNNNKHNKDIMFNIHNEQLKEIQKLKHENIDLKEELNKVKFNNNNFKINTEKINLTRKKTIQKEEDLLLKDVDNNKLVNKIEILVANNHSLKSEIKDLKINHDTLIEDYKIKIQFLEDKLNEYSIIKIENDKLNKKLKEISRINNNNKENSNKNIKEINHDKRFLENKNVDLILSKKVSNIKNNDNDNELLDINKIENTQFINHDDSLLLDINNNYNFKDFNEELKHLNFHKDNLLQDLENMNINLSNKENEVAKLGIKLDKGEIEKSKLEISVQKLKMELDKINKENFSILKKNIELEELLKNNNTTNKNIKENEIKINTNSETIKLQKYQIDKLNNEININKEQIYKINNDNISLIKNNENLKEEVNKLNFNKELLINEKNIINNELVLSNEEVDYYKYSYEEQNIKFSKEHELISNSLYELALQFIGLKTELQKRVNENK